MRYILATLFLLSTFKSFSQEENNSPKYKFYFYWGYNKASFTKSNIHFTGKEYDFTLNNVVAKDRQSAVKLEFLNPAKLSIPQYNYRFGYYLKKGWIVSVGFDHMKYVVEQNQNVTINGNIDSEYNSDYGNDYNGEEITIEPSFLLLEHTNGLNYINVHLDKSFEIWSKDEEKYGLYTSAGLGTGILYPKSDVTLMHNDRNDQWHLAGYGFSAVSNLRFVFFKNFFLEYNLKGGFIHMPDVITTSSKNDRANQSFFFLERFGVAGFTFTL